MSRLAVACLVFAIIGSFTVVLLVPAVIAVVCGHLAHYRINHDRSKLRGWGMATTGMIMGYVNIVAWPIFVAAIVFFYPYGKEWYDDYSNRKERESSLQAGRLYIECEKYLDANAGKRYPEKWDDLKRYISPVELEDLLASPHGKEAPFPAFELTPHRRPVLKAARGSVMVVREIAPPDVPEITVVFADGTQKRLVNPAFQE